MRLIELKYKTNKHGLSVFICKTNKCGSSVQFPKRRIDHQKPTLGRERKKKDGCSSAFVFFLLKTEFAED